MDKELFYFELGRYRLRLTKDMERCVEDAPFVNLMAILEDHTTRDYFYDDPKEFEEANVAAYQALIAFQNAFSALKPDKKYCTTGLTVGGGHIEYIEDLLCVRREFETKKYTNVCSELQKLLYYNRKTFLQPRIYYNVLKLLKTYL